MTLLGTIISSDKTNISAMTGNCVAHPLLISLADIVMDFQMKSSHCAFMLLTIFPVPKFLHKNRRIRGVLENCLTHECIDFIMEPLKIATEIGIMMSDPLGWHQYCFTPLAAAIIDTPKVLMYAGISPRASVPEHPLLPWPHTNNLAMPLSMNLEWRQPPLHN